VLANGGVAAACALLAMRYGLPLLAAFAGAFAAASADTWGTEIGSVLGGVPRSIATLRPVAAGLSGGVTFAGTLAEIVGAAAVALASTAIDARLFVPVFAGGVAGAFVDSLLGATVQSLRFCPRCARACETDPHACGAATAPQRGASWFGNDAVNFAATLAGALAAGLLVRL